MCLFYKCILKKSNDSQSASFHGCGRYIRSLELLLLNSPFLVRHVPSPPRKNPWGIPVVGRDSYNSGLGAGGCFHHPSGNNIHSFPCCQWEWVLELEVLAQKETRVSLQKRGMRMERARGEVSRIDWCVKGLPGAPLLRDSPGRCKAGINNCSIGALFALLAQSQRTLVTAYHPAESPRNAVRGKCACSHDIY